MLNIIFFFSSRRRHTRLQGDWSSDVCSSDLATAEIQAYYGAETGLEAALNAIRGNVQPNGIPATTRMGFLNAVKRTTSNRSEERRVGKENRYRMTTAY